MSSCYSGYDDRSFEFDDSNASFDSGYEKSFETDCVATKRRLCFDSGVDFYPALDAPASTALEQSQFLALLDTNSNHSSRSGKTLAEHLISKAPLLDVDATNPFEPKLGVQTSTPTKKTLGDAAPTEPKPKRKYAVGKNRVTRSRSPLQVVRIKKFRRMKANDRERNRMHTLNDALERLRVTLPSLPEETKLTKIEILRFAHNYIFALEQVLQSGNTINLDLEKLQNFTLSGERITKEIFDALFVNPPPYHLMGGTGYTMSPTRIALLQQQQQQLLHSNQRPHHFPHHHIQQTGFGAPDLYNGQYGTGAIMGPNQEDFGPHYSAEKHQIFRNAFEAAANVKMPALADYTRQQSPSQYGGMDPNYAPHLPTEQQIQPEFASQARSGGAQCAIYPPGMEESTPKPHHTGIHHSSSFYSQTPPWKDYSEQMANTQQVSFGQFSAL